MPIFTMMEKEYGSFPTPRNFNYLWNFGAMAMVMYELFSLLEKRMTAWAHRGQQRQ
mgnify:CR=1 FL=1